ncbi:MAG: acyltransferase [Ilumatobacteraceae bacterium]
MKVQLDAVETRVGTYQPALDGLRGICIAAVLLYHLDPGGWFQGGLLGVSVFFTLSGFLITRNLVGELDRGDRVDVVRFWSRRVQRLAPAALATLAAITIVTVISERGWAAAGLARNATAAVWGVANWNMIDVGRTNVLSGLGPVGPMWSLAVEEQFYFGIAILFVVLRGRNAIRNLTLVLSAICIASVVIALMLGAYVPRREFGTDTRAGELALGALLAIVASRHPELFTRRVPVQRAMGASCLAMLGLLFVGIGYHPDRLARGWIIVVGLLSVGAIVGLLSGGPLTTLAAWRPLVALGRISYALYLVHWPIILFTRDPLLGLTGTKSDVVRVVLCVLAACVLHLVIEQPARRKKIQPRRIMITWLAASVAVTVGAYALL